MTGAPSKSRKSSPAAANISGAVAAPLPKGVEPELPTLATAPPSGENWLHEIKFDGYRILATVEQGRVSLTTRKGNDWTERMPTLAKALQTIPVETALLDGELVCLDKRGMSDFQGLQDALGGGPARDARLVYFAFDLLYLNGIDLRGVGLAQRKALLAELLTRIPPPFANTIRLSDHVIGQGPAFFAQAARMGLEGIVSKQLAAPYRSGRSRNWLKMKCSQRQEFVVVGFTEPKGTRSLLGALLLATYTSRELVYRGRVGTGFSEASLRDLHRKLCPVRPAAHPRARTERRRGARSPLGQARPGGRGFVLGIDPGWPASPFHLSRPARGQTGLGGRSRRGEASSSYPMNLEGSRLLVSTPRRGRVGGGANLASHAQLRAHRDLRRLGDLGRGPHDVDPLSLSGTSSGVVEELPAVGRHRIGARAGIALGQGGGSLTWFT
jgi:DNA ligase D-like protein (predicted ligase)